MSFFDDYLYLALSLGIGLLIGLERGWKERGAPDGSRVAGFRTIGLMGLFGGSLGLLAQIFGAFTIAAGIIGASMLLALGFYRDTKSSSEVSITTMIAALLAIALGALATSGYPGLSVSAAVIVTLILSLKPMLHKLLQRLAADELTAILRFLLISVVILPLLPDQGYGPYEAFNPYLIWWMVVLVSGLSFAGYIAVRAWGAKQGLVLTAGFGALVSSTAVTFALAREARLQPEARLRLSSAIILASTIMTLRMILVASVIQPALFFHVLLALLPMTMSGALIVLVFHRSANKLTEFAYRPENPFDLRIALFFGLGLGVVLLATRYLEDQIGVSGLLGLSFVTGILDVDAIVISASQLLDSGTGIKDIVSAIVIAAVANSLSKLVISLVVGGRAIYTAIISSFLMFIFTGGLSIFAIWYFL